jgi:hypothetical protein
MERLLHDVKSKKYLLIAKAGLAVTTEEMSGEQLFMYYLVQVAHHISSTR